MPDEPASRALHTNPAPSLRRSPLSHIQRPAITLTCLGLLLLLTLGLPRGGLRRSTVAEFFFPTRSFTHITPKLHLTVVIENGKTTVLADWKSDALATEGDLWTQAAAGEAIVTDVSYWRYARESGLFAPTRRITVHNLLMGSEITPEQAKLITKAVTEFLSHEESADLREYSAELADFVGERTERLTSGYIHNAVLLFSFAFFLLSLGWIHQIPGWLREHRRQTRLLHRRCPNCNYSLLGLAESPNPTCPECGEKL